MLYFEQLSISNKPFQLLLLKLWHIINQHLGREMGGRFKREGIYVYRWLIHVEVWQKTTKFYKAIILQLKNKLILKNNQHQY